MTKIFTVTSSARGHAICSALKKSTPDAQLISACSSANPGILSLAEECFVTDLSDIDALCELAQKHNPDFAVIGPEDPICAGLADRLQELGIGSVAPLKSLARIEGSKGFTRDLLTKYGIDASPKYKVFTAENEADIRSYLSELHDEYVVKYDSLKGGKGVKLSGEHLATPEDGVAYAEECISEAGQVVVEEKLIGIEFSLISFVSGTTVVDTPVIQDHKRAYDGDTGPNTGGMGTYSCADHGMPFLTAVDIARASEINRQVAEVLMKECGSPYRGFLYGGFIAVKDGVRLIEYNCRLGDPEALNILPLLSSNFTDICRSILSNELTEEMVRFAKKASICRYITPSGYPENKDQKGQEVRFPSLGDGAEIYYGDISQEGDGRLLLGGSRTAGIVAMADTLELAEARVTKLCAQVEGPVRYRNDIGTTELVRQRIDTMKRLRGN